MSEANGRPRVLLLTSEQLPNLHHDDAPLVAAFEAAGWQARPTVWSDAGNASGDLALVRSCWDYVPRWRGFLTAMEEVGTRMPLWNPASTLRWNVDKRYLVELAGQGIAVPPTAIVTVEESRSLDSIMNELGSDQLVVKPLVGGGGADTWRADPRSATAWDRATAIQDLVVQPFIPEVVADGEWSLVFINGRYSHSALKLAAEGEFRVQEEHGGTVQLISPPEEMVTAAEAALEVIGHPWCYCRVDLVAVGGRFLVMEVELLEPELFFTLAPGSAERLVEALIRVPSTN